MSHPDMTSDYIVYSRFHEVVRAAHLARIDRQQRAENQPDWLAMVQTRQMALLQSFKTALQPALGQFIKSTAPSRSEAITTRLSPYFRS